MATGEVTRRQDADTDIGSANNGVSVDAQDLRKQVDLLPQALPAGGGVVNNTREDKQDGQHERMEPQEHWDARGSSGDARPRESLVASPEMGISQGGSLGVDRLGGRALGGLGGSESREIGRGAEAVELAQPQPVENLVQNAAPGTGAEPLAPVQKPKLQLVRTISALTPHQEPRTSAAPVRKLVSPLESLGAETGNGIVQQASHHLPHEWRTTWKTTSTDVRSLWKRLWVQENGKWRYATRKDREAGLIPNVVINQEVRSFSLEGAARIKRLGDENVRRGIESLLNRRAVRQAA